MLVSCIQCESKISNKASLCPVCGDPDPFNRSEYQSKISIITEEKTALENELRFHKYEKFYGIYASKLFTKKGLVILAILSFLLVLIRKIVHFYDGRELPLWNDVITFLIFPLPLGMMYFFILVFMIPFLIMSSNKRTRNKILEIKNRINLLKEDSKTLFE